MSQSEEKPKFQLRPEVVDASRSAARRLEDHFDAIEHYLAHGVSRQAILDQLNTMGFSLTMTCMATMLSRIRKRRNQTLSPPIKSTPTHQATKPERIFKPETGDVRPQKFIHDLTTDVGWKPKAPERKTA